jgi:hypothetical protein
LRVVDRPRFVDPLRQVSSERADCRKSEKIGERKLRTQFLDQTTPISVFPDVEFLDRIRQLNSVSDEMLRNEEMMSLLLPTLRADLQMCDTYIWRPREPLECRSPPLVGSKIRRPGAPSDDVARAYTLGIR